MNIFELFFSKASDEEITETIKKLKNVNVKDNYGQTPLWCACFYDRSEIVKFLIESGADVNIEDDEGRTPLFESCWHENIEIVKYLIEHDADVQNEFEDCFKSRNIDRIKLLTKAGACFI